MEKIMDELLYDQDSKHIDGEYIVSWGLNVDLVHDIPDCMSFDPSYGHLGNGHVVATPSNKVVKDYNDPYKTRGFPNHSKATFHRS